MQEGSYHTWLLNNSMKSIKKTIAKLANKLFKPLPLGGVGVGLLLACSSIDCPVQNTVATNYAILGADGEAATLADTLYIWTCRADGQDTLLNRLTGTNSFSLPVSYTHPEDTLIFYITDSYHQQTLDTVFLKKEDIPHFESVDCAAHFFHRLTAVRSTHDGIDSITIVNPHVNYDQSKAHLNIYFKKRY